MGRAPDVAPARRRPVPVGRHRGLLPDQRAEPGDRRAAHARRHPLQGHRRHPLLRPARGQGRAGLPEGRGQPGRRGERQAGAQRAQARASATARSAGSTPGPTRHGSPFIEALRRADDAGVTWSGGQGHRVVPRAARRARPSVVDDGPGDAARGGARPLGLRGRARGRALDRGRGPAREPGRAGRRGARVRRGRRVPRAGRPGGRHRRPRRRRLVGRAHDPALGQGPRVPGRCS